jgi:hypothetical protein
LIRFGARVEENYARWFKRRAITSSRAELADLFGTKAERN